MLRLGKGMEGRAAAVVGCKELSRGTKSLKLRAVGEWRGEQKAVLQKAAVCVSSITGLTGI